MPARAAAGGTFMHSLELGRDLLEGDVRPDLDSQARNDTVQKFHAFDFKRDFCGGAGIFQKRGAK